MQRHCIPAQFAKFYSSFVKHNKDDVAGVVSLTSGRHPQKISNGVQ